MEKRIKHENMLQPNPGKRKDGYNYFEFICRGGNIRRNIWNGFISSISEPLKRKEDNSYLMLVEEPSNKYDPNAVMILCRGEFFGTVGYVGREFTVQVKEILEKCWNYRIDMIDESMTEEREIPLLLTWETHEQYKINQELKDKKRKLSDEEKVLRKELQLPVTKPLRYMRRLSNLDYEEVEVTSYKIVDTYMPSETHSLEIVLETGEELRILAPFFSHMQKPSFVEDMLKEQEND